MGKQRHAKLSKQRKRTIIYSYMLFILLIAIIVTYFGSTFIKSCYKKYTTSEISYSEFLDMIHMNEIASVTYSSSKIVITPKEQPVKGVTFCIFSKVTPLTASFR